MNNTTIEVPKSGELIVPMTNDYLFKIMLQENNNVLKALVQGLTGDGALKFATELSLEMS